MTNRTRALVTATCVAWLAGCSAEKKPAPPAPPPPAAAPKQDGTVLERSDQVTATAKVVRVDQRKRLVTLRGPEGNEVTVKVDDNVKNLKQVRAGDEVVATYTESIAVRILKPGEGKRGVAAAEEVETAEPGQMPGGAAARTVTITAKIKAIDTKKQTVTLKGPEGNLRTVKVRHPENLAKVKVGDLVQLTYSEAVAIAVEKAAK